MENKNTKAVRQGRRKAEALPVPPVMSMSELAKLGGGKVAYIKIMTPDEACRKASTCSRCMPQSGRRWR